MGYGCQTYGVDDQGHVYDSDAFAAGIQGVGEEKACGVCTLLNPVSFT